MATHAENLELVHPSPAAIFVEALDAKWAMSTDDVIPSAYGGPESLPLSFTTPLSICPAATHANIKRWPNENPPTDDAPIQEGPWLEISEPQKGFHTKLFPHDNQIHWRTFYSTPADILPRRPRTLKEFGALGLQAFVEPQRSPAPDLKDTSRDLKLTRPQVIEVIRWIQRAQIER